MATKAHKSDVRAAEINASGPQDPHSHGGDHGTAKSKDIEIEVNSRVVTLPDREVTGLQIKQAAIEQGVIIQVNFVLQQELPNGSSQIIGDGDLVRIHRHMSFTALAPDDNS